MFKMEPRSKIATCIRCSVVFTVRDPLAPRGQRVPHILHCGHSICESCLLSSLQVDASVACIKCAKQSLQKLGMKSLNKEFPINLFILGQFTERHRFRAPQDSKITFVPPNSHALAKPISKFPMTLVGEPQLSCSECNENNAEWSCENCPANYCSPCFTKVHGAAKSLKTHIRAPISVHVIPMCTTHSDQRKDFFCHQCNEIICPCCAISFHSGHPVVTRAQMNEEYMDNVLAAVMVASAVLEEITKSQQELINFLPPEERSPGNARLSAGADARGGSGRECDQSGSSENGGPLEGVERAVLRHFAYAHGLLQLLEAQVLQRLDAAAGATKSSARAALDQLAGAADRTRALLAEANRVATAGQLKWCDLRGLTQRLLDTRNERCRLVQTEQSEPRFSFNVDPEFASLLMNHCRLEVSTGSIIQLEPLGDSPTGNLKHVVATSPVSCQSPTNSSASPGTQKPPEAVSMGSSQLPTEPPSPSTPIATANIVATAAAAALAASNRSSQSMEVTAPHVVVEDKSSVWQQSKAARNPPRRSSRGRANKKGRDNFAGQSRNVTFHSSVYGGSSEADVSVHPTLHGPPLVQYPPLHGPPPPLHGPPVVQYPPLHGPPPPLHGPPSSLHGPPPSLHGPPPSLHGPPPSLHGPPPSLRGPPPSLHGPPVQYSPLPVPPDPPLLFCNKEIPPEKPFVAIGKPEVVRVVHIKNPSTFYVHRDQDKQILDDLQKFLDVCPEREYSPPPSVTIGEMYICKFLVDDRWYRVIVKSYSAMLNPPESRDSLVDVFYVDYGNSERIPLSRLRPLPSELKDVPTYALHCALFDLYPKKEDQWPEDSNRAFCKMVNGACVHMNVMSFKDEVYYIDLCAIPGMKHSNFPVSVRDAMVFMDLAQLDDESSLNVRQASSHFDYEYLKEEKLIKNENFPVVLSHIDNPSQFYAQRRGSHAEYLTKLLDDMSKFYNTNKDGMIYDPGVGMPCAAQFSLDKGWYRAQVLNIPRKSWVEVMYVDYGNREEVPYTSIRKLPETFMKIPPQAIECSLGDVMPTKGNTWPKTATDFFLSITKDKELRLLVNDVSKSYVKVVLYEEKENVDVCLNALLVREGHALSIGVGASIVEYFKVEAAVPEEASLFQAIQPSRKKFRRTVKTDPGGVGFLADDKKNDTSELTEKSGSSTGPVSSIPVNIVTVNSPGCIFVSQCSKEEEISCLIADMQEFYNGLPVSKIKWEEKEKCCCWSDKNKKWYRAVILEVNDEKVKVFYKDVASTEIVPIANLRELDEQFLNVQDGAFRCHMVGIQPAGGQNKWSSVSCELFCDLVYKTYSELFITKKGDVEDDSLPIELWARFTVSPGPLEPNRIEWISLNQILVNKGMAIPTMRMAQELNERDARSFKLSSNTGFLESNIEDTDSDENYKYKMESTDDVDSSEDEEIYRHELLLCPENPKQQWLDPPPLKKHRFMGLTTYVDLQGLIHLHDIDDSETLTLIREALNECLKDSKPKPQDMYWFPGQICIAQFYADKHWYRGKIIKENEENVYEVLFVDYGNTELCNIEMLRKDVMMAHIPILCRKFQLHDIVPASIDGKWDMNHLDFLHASLDGKKCTVIVRSSLDDPCPSISLSLPGKIDVAELLVSLHYAIYSSNVLGNDVASTGGSENSVIIENVEETIEMMNDSADLNIKTRNPRTDKNSSLTEPKLDTCDSDYNYHHNEVVKIQNSSSVSEVSHLESKSGGDKMKDFKVCISLSEGGGGDFSRRDSTNELVINEGAKAVIMGEFGDIADTQIGESAQGPCDSYISDKCVKGASLCGEVIHFERDSQDIGSSYPQNVTGELNCTSESDLKNNNDSVDNDSMDNTEIKEVLKNVECVNMNSLPQICATSTEQHEAKTEVEKEEVREPPEDLSYKQLNFDDCDTIIAEVTIVMDDPTQIVLVPIVDKNEKIFSGDDFHQMTMQMQNEAPLQPAITNPQIGQPCCALYFEDKQWYRAIILKVQSDKAKVRVEFVDYGNLEWIDINRIRSIKPAWIAQPTIAIKCRLWNVRVPEDCAERMLVKVLTKLIFNSVLTAKVRGRNPLAVELFRYNSTALVYQPLLETGLLDVCSEEKGESKK